MASQGEKKRLEQKYMVLQSPGLDITPGLNDHYGANYHGQDAAGCYAGCLKCAGWVCSCACCVCATCGCGPVRIVKQGFIGMKEEFGKLKAKLGPGIHTFNPCTEKVTMVDLRVQSLNTAPQKLLTKDNVSVHIDVFVNYKIIVPEFAMYKTSNYFNLLNLMVQSVMKTIVSERTLAQLLCNRKEIEKSTTHIMDEKAHPYGIDVISIETQSIQLPPAMERAMATVAESEKESDAKSVKAKGNLESAKAFRTAADELSKNPLSIELKYFETMKEVACEGISTLVVPSSILDTVNKKMKR